LVGGNGSGKSTLIKIMAGVFAADAGEMTSVAGSYDLTHYSAADSVDVGLRFVHQDLGIFPVLTVAENLGLGGRFDTDRFHRIRSRASQQRAREALARFDLDLDPKTRAASLSTPQKALLAIARALQDIDDDHRAVLFLDEPTAALPAGEADVLLQALRQLADRGHCVVLVSHRLDEVRAIADRVTAIRDGHNVGTLAATDMTESRLVELILGNRLVRTVAAKQRELGSEPVLEVVNVSGGPIKDVSFAIRPGEVVGLAGLLGSGRTELLELIYGARKRTAGHLTMRDQSVRGGSTKRMASLGMAFVPEDRNTGGVLSGESVAANMTAGHTHRYFTRGLIQRRRMAAEVGRDIKRYAVKTGSSRAPIESLSGGNQQKVVLGRWLRTDPAVLLLDEPTQGIDVGARETILSLVVAASEAGTAVILASSEFEELTRLCHRILILSQGRIVGECATTVSSHELLEAVLTGSERSLT
jgi:ribose transport system ATP-binding protein